MRAGVLLASLGAVILAAALAIQAIFYAGDFPPFGLAWLAVGWTLWSGRVPSTDSGTAVTAGLR